MYAKGNRCHNGHYTGNNECGLGRDPISGIFDAVVTDELVERGTGDIDIGEYGDGEWPVSWYVSAALRTRKLYCHQLPNIRVYSAFGHSLSHPE